MEKTNMTMITRPQVKEWNLIHFTIPENNRLFELAYKDILFTCRRMNEFVSGESILGELKLHTTMNMILEHDTENETYTKWRYME